MDRRKAIVGRKGFWEEFTMRVFAFATAMALGGMTSAGALTLTSPDIKQGARIADEQVFNGWDCTGKNVSPGLSWSGAPKGVKSFAVSVYDPDAPTGSGFWHWWVANIPADATSLAKGAGDDKGAGLPAGSLQVRNDFSAIGYGGPCPPKGKPHHYVISLYALDLDKLGVDQNASPAVIGFYVNAHTMAKATLTGLWGR
jgi:Raf kinase inhibitor-like YbhB/YbcL family protein